MGIQRWCRINIYWFICRWVSGTKVTLCENLLTPNHTFLLSFPNFLLTCPNKVFEVCGLIRRSYTCLLLTERPYCLGASLLFNTLRLTFASLIWDFSFPHCCSLEMDTFRWVASGACSCQSTHSLPFIFSFFFSLAILIKSYPQSRKLFS